MTPMYIHARDATMQHATIDYATHASNEHFYWYATKYEIKVKYTLSHYNRIKFGFCPWYGSIKSNFAL